MRSETEALMVEVLREQLRELRARREERERENREREFELFLARRYGYPPPGSRRRRA